MIHPWTGYARELLQNMLGTNVEPAPGTWIQAIPSVYTELTTDPEWHQLAMECLRNHPPRTEEANTAFCTLCALLEYFWSGHATLPDTEIQDYLERWRQMQSAVCAEYLPSAQDMVHWLQNTSYVLKLTEAQCSPLLNGTIADIAAVFPHIDDSSSASAPSLHPVFVHVRQGLTTPRLFATQVEMAQILSVRLQHPKFNIPTIKKAELETLEIDHQIYHLHENQSEAVAKALASPLTVITGGPGTGKTSIIQKILELCIKKLAIDPSRILLSAPTGKAARRMGEAVNVPGIPSPQTLHRLLELRPNSVSPFHDGRQIQADIVIIDELSMLGFDLAVNMLRAISNDTRLILIGDPEQLPPVDCGNLLEALVTPSPQTMTEGLAKELKQVCVRLTKNYRIQSKDEKKSDNIFTIQTAVMTKNKGLPAFAQLTPKLPKDFVFRDFEYCEDMTQTQNALDAWIDQIQNTWLQSYPTDALSKVLSHLYTIDDNRIQPKDEALLLNVFKHLEKFRLLTPMNRSTFGANTFNRYLMHKLGLKTDQNTRHLPVGCLILLTQNSYQIQHFNGETGLIIQDQYRHKHVVFPAADQDHAKPDAPKFDLFSLDLVPQIIPAFAMSVHKSQGSQYDHVLIILSPHPSPLLSANMLYTAISRCKHSAALLATPEILPSCVR